MTGARLKISAMGGVAENWESVRSMSRVYSRVSPGCSDMVGTAMSSPCSPTAMFLASGKGKDTSPSVSWRNEWEDSSGVQYEESVALQRPARRPSQTDPE